VNYIEWEIFFIAQFTIINKVDENKNKAIFELVLACWGWIQNWKFGMFKIIVPHVSRKQWHHEYVENERKVLRYSSWRNNKKDLCIMPKQQNLFFHTNSGESYFSQDLQAFYSAYCHWMRRIPSTSVTERTI
jgi:hypothetical protein